MRHLGPAVQKNERRSDRNSPNAIARSPKQRVFSGARSPLSPASPYGFFSAVGSPRGPPGTRSPPGIHNPIGARSPRARSPEGARSPGILSLGARSPGFRTPAVRSGAVQSPASPRSPVSGTGQLSPQQDLELGADDSHDNLGYYRGAAAPLRQRHHSVRCVDVLIYYGIVVSTFLLYSVGFIAYKLDEDPEEVKEFYRTMTTSTSHTIFKIGNTKHLERDEQAATVTERSIGVDGEDTGDRELPTSTDAVTDANEVEQWQRYIAVPPPTRKTGLASLSPPSQAPSGYSRQHSHETQDQPDDTFVHLLRAVAANENRRRASQHGATPTSGVGANATTVPFLTFPGLSQW